MQASKMRPALRYHGGKWRLAPWIIEHFPPHRVYVEPFGGAASVLLRKPRSYAEVYNDLDDEVVGFFRVLRDPGQSALLRQALELTPFARVEFDAAYEETSDPVERSRRLVIRSFMGFGSDSSTSVSRAGFRANSNRSGSTPAHDWVSYAECFHLLADRFLGVVIENRPAVAVMAHHDAPTTLHYVDPPYVHGTRTSGKHAYKHEMTDVQHADLLAFLGTLSGAVILSGYPHPLYDEMLSGWQRIERKAFADGARQRTEVLWLNDRASNGYAQPSMLRSVA